MREQYIRRAALRYGLDPAAVLAIAQHEGLSGGIGDNGTSFGPFQLHQGGALPSGHANPQKWAWSNAGIDYALRQMANSGARGLHGRAAVSAISHGFERPADPAAEIADAMAHYKNSGSPTRSGFGGSGNQVMHMGGGAGGGKMLDTATFHKQAAMLMLHDAVARSRGEQVPNILGQLQKARKAATIRVAGGVNQTAAGNPKMPDSLGGGAGAAAVRMAARQIGQPYVWGGESPKSGFDCSGLVQWAYGALGIKLPRVAVDQGRSGKAVRYGAMRPGDLLVENNGDHVVMYAGGGRVIQAPHTGEKVQYSPLSWFPANQYHARRVA